MENLTYQRYLEDHSMQEQIMRDARRAQTEAIGQLVVQMVRFCARLTSIRIRLQAPPRASS
jgi:hypothetical protein